MLLRGNDGIFADKDWLLLRSGGKMEYNTKYDFSLDPLVGFKLSELIGMEWTPACKYVNLLINNQYKGVYLLVESVKRNTKCRINVDKEGYIFERDPYWWNESIYFETSWTDYFRYTFKYPDEDYITEEDLSYLSEMMGQVETSIIDGTYPDYIECSSFVNWLLAHDILGTSDASGSNMFFSKFDKTQESLVKMPVLWDFDTSFGMPVDEFSQVHLDSPYFPLKSPNKQFLCEYIARYEEVKESIFSQLISFFESYESSEEARAIDKSRELELTVWGGAICFS